MPGYSHANTAEMLRRYEDDRNFLAVYAKMQREPISKTIGSMIKYCSEHMAEDPLIFPVKENPFRGKKSCSIL